MRKTLITVIASLVVHGAPFVLLARFPGALTALSPSPPASAEPIDRWSGTTVALGGDRIYDVNLDPPGGGQPRAPALPALPAPDAPPPPMPPSPAAPPEAPPPEPTPKPVAPKPPPPKPSPRTEDAPKDPDAIRPAPPAKPRRRHEPAPTGSATASPGPAASGSGGPSGGSSGGSFGAEGPGSVRDLGRAFTRAIPPACQADPAWGKLALGDVGVLEVTIAIDETGHILPWKPAESDGPKQLVALVKRTLSLLEAGTFGLRPGAVSAGTEVIRIRAALSDVDASETGGAAGLAFAYDQGKGRAAFTQPGGRHVEVTVQVVKVREGG